MCGNSGNCGPWKICVLRITDPSHLCGAISPVQLAMVTADYYAKGLVTGTVAYAVIDNGSDSALLLTEGQYEQFAADMSGRVLASTS